MRLVRKLLNTNIIVDVLDAIHNPWRSGRLGRLANRHSPTGHVNGVGCWCIKKPWTTSQAFAWGMLQADMQKNRREIIVGDDVD